jgi:hypothetical protein
MLTCLWCTNSASTGIRSYDHWTVTLIHDHCILLLDFSPMAHQPQVGQGLPIIVALRSHSDTRHWVGLLWTSDQSDAETCIRQHTILTRDRHPCPQRDSKPQSQQASVRKPTP